jgi:hypothetical protein
MSESFIGLIFIILLIVVVVIGVSQSSSKRWRTPTAGLWIVVSALGWGLGMIFVDDEFMMLLLMGLVYSVFTGAGLMWISRKGVGSISAGKESTSFRLGRSQVSPLQVGGNWGFLASWVLVGAIGLAIGVSLGPVIAEFLDSMDPDFYEAIGWVVGACIGLCIGLGQWMVLRKERLNGGWWIGSMVIAWSIAVQMWVNLLWRGDSILEEWVYILQDLIGLEVELGIPLILGGLAGLIIGLGQWYVLKGRKPNAQWWLPANIVAWILCYWIIINTEVLYNLEFSVFSLIAGGIAALIIGLTWIIKLGGSAS